MKLRRILAILPALLPFLGWAQTISQEQACRNVEQFLQGSVAASRSVKPVKTTDLKLSYATRGMAAPALYVFNVADKGGYVVASGDERAYAILGYSTEGSFEETKAPCCVKWLLGEYERQISYAREHQLQAPTRATDTRQDILPLLSSKWDQGNPYNGKCPIDPNTGDRCITGCVATAMAQLMYYHRWPNRGTGSHSYEWRGETLSADFWATEYRFGLMKNTYKGNERDDNLATLLYHCGVAVNMDYSSSASSAYCDGWELAKYFGYSNHYYRLSLDEMGEEEFLDKVYKNLKNRRPLLYSGNSGNSGGHEFVCDGYRNDGYLHFNFGWSGWCDDYYRPTAIKTDNGNYSSHQSAIGGLMPKTVSVTVDGLRYDLVDDEAYLIGGDPVGHLEVPSVITFNGNQYTVCCIEAGAFCENEQITSVTIPASVESLRDSCFKNCLNLKELRIEDSDKQLSVGWAPFDETSLEKIYVGRNLSRSFYLYDRVSEIEIGPLVTALCEGFLNGMSVRHVRIPASVISIGLNALSNYSLESIEVDEANTTYSSVDGVLFDKSQKRLLAYPRQRQCHTYVVPSTVTSFGQYAFSSVWCVDSLIINEGTATLAEYALAWSGFQYVSFPSTLNRIMGHGCENLYVRRLDLHETTPPRTGENSIVIENSDHEIYVPVGTLDKWKRSIDWRKLNIKEFPLEIDGLLYTKLSETELRLDGGQVNDGLVVPSEVEYNEKHFTVTEINEEAFRDNGNVTSVHIPATIRKVGSRAFFYSGIRKLTIADSPEMLETGPYSFYAENLSDVYMGRSWKSPDQETPVFGWGVKHLVLGEQVKSIPDNGLFGTQIDTLHITANVQTIGEKGIPGDVSCIELHPDNQHFVMDGGALLTADRTRMLKYLTSLDVERRKYVMPATVKRIDAYSFSYASLDSIGISGQLEYIGEYALRWSLSGQPSAALHFPATLSQIEDMGLTNSGATWMEVDPDNPNFMSQDGMVFNKQRTELVAVPTNINSRIVVPAGVGVVRNHALQNVNAPAIVLPASVEQILEYGIYGPLADSLVVPCQVPPQCESYGVYLPGYKVWDEKLRKYKQRKTFVYIPQGTLSAYLNAAVWMDVSNYVEIPDDEVGRYVALGIDERFVIVAQPTGETYDLNGRRSQGMRRGLNIVRMSDGTWRKVVRR